MPSSTTDHGQSTFRFVKRDIGKDHRSKLDPGDCTVRALSIAAGIRWPEAWQLLYAFQGRHQTTSFCLTEFMKAEPDTFGVLRVLPFPAERGKPRMTPRRFAGQYPAGNFILSLAHHVVAIEDGVLYDRWDCSDRCVYTAFQIDPAAFIHAEDAD